MHAPNKPLYKSQKSYLWKNSDYINLSTFFVASAVLKTKPQNIALFLEIKFGINFVNTFSNKSSKCQRKEKSNTETVP